MSRSQSRAEYGRFAHLFVGGVEWLLSQWQALTGGEETDLHSHAASGGGSGPTLVTKAASYSLLTSASGKTFRPTAGGVVFTLPVLADNLLYTFISFRHPVNAADAMTVQPRGSDHIVDASNSIGNTDPGVGIRDTFGDRDGYSIQLLGVAGQGWVVIGGIDLGTWEPAT
jgi:hypothetical protein